MVEVDAILTLFHGKSLLWPERPGRPSGILTSEEYEDAYRGEPRAWGSPAHRRLVPGPGWVTGAHLPAGYSVAVGEFNDDPKTKGTVRWARATGRVRGGGDRMGAGHTRALRCPPETSGTRAAPAVNPHVLVPTWCQGGGTQGSLPPPQSTWWGSPTRAT